MTWSRIMGEGYKKEELPKLEDILPEVFFKGCNDMCDEDIEQ